MFNVGGPEILVIFLVALIVLGPQQLPKAMRTFGNVMAEVRKVSSSFQAEMRSAMDAVDTTGSDAKAATSSADSTSSSQPDSSMNEIVARNDNADQPSSPSESSDPNSAERAAG
ncbi:MAG: twin-arginine translocase subunit TatB [Acidimicrobiales bacterium]|nr:twin-arginine translocase subunit TatB [Acidimicrobiales bacterium]